MSIHDDPPREQTPTPIDPADIRPGDEVDVHHRFVVREVVDDLVTSESGFTYIADGDWSWHLVHRPDPDAEAVEVMEAVGMTYVRTYLEELRKRGWDVTRRQP